MGGQPLGSAGQVVVVANCGWPRYPDFGVECPWAPGLPVREYGGTGQPLPLLGQGGPGTATLGLDRFQVRVFGLEGLE